MKERNITKLLRKSAIAQVQIKHGTGNIIVNGKVLEEYMQNNLKRVFIINF